MGNHLEYDCKCTNTNFITVLRRQLNSRPATTAVEVLVGLYIKRNYLLSDNLSLSLLQSFGWRGHRLCNAMTSRETNLKKKIIIPEYSATLSMPLTAMFSNATVSKALRAPLTLQTFFADGKWPKKLLCPHFLFLFLPKYFNIVCVYFSLLSSTSKALSLSDTCEILRCEQVHVWHMYRCNMYNVLTLGLLRSTEASM